MPTRRRRTFAFIIAVACLLAASWQPFLAPVEAQSGTPIQVDAAAGRHAIDPRVYGVAYATASQLGVLNVPVNRWGGNTSSRHNWQTNGDNRGSDWYFESIPGTSTTQGAAGDSFIQDARSNGAEALLTIPLLPWIGKEGAGHSKLASFSAVKYGAQQDCDWSYYADACNGVLANGNKITGNDPNDANVASTPALQKLWIQHLVGKWGLAANGGQRYYIYDNEPSLWHSTHRDVHPTGQTMTELRDLMISYGTAIRQADPGAVLIGPEEWGWSGYFYSGYDQKYNSETGCWSCSPDKTANGGMDYLPWLLQQMKAKETATGARLLNVFTVHFYPQGGQYGSDTSTSMQALRNRSTRALWDPNYVDESWIGDKVQLIPRLRGWVNSYYPGTETGITEYNWGAESHINGATTQADILGIFGREGLNVGTLWTTPATTSVMFKALQMYRNYDGAKSTFGDTGVSATVANPDNLSAFAAERASDGALTVMAINKVTTSALVNLSLANFTPGAAAQVWQLTSSNVIQHLADASLSGSTLNTTLPAQSITLFVIPKATSTTPSLSVGDVSVSEGNSGTTTATFTVTRSGSTAAASSAAYATANGTATAGSDYTAASGTVSFAAGETSKTVAVSVTGDTTIESNETFTLTLSNPTNATLARASGTGTIVNDDFPALSINDVTVAEGNSGTTIASFTVSLSAAAPFASSVNYATADGTATAGSDYAALTGNLTFAAGQTSKTISVTVNGDTTVEPNETFFVNLSAASGATIADAQGVGTITNDDSAPLPTLSINDVTLAEGNSGTSLATFTVSLSASSASPVTVAYATANGTATAGSDYVAASGTLTFAAGETTKTIPVTVNGDTTVEPNETFFVNLSAASGATIADAQGVGTITNDDSVPTGEAVVWTNAMGVSVAGNTITKTATTAWGNAGAASTRGLSGNGYVEMTLPSSPGYVMAGLSNGDSDLGYADIDFALYTYPGATQLLVYEKGTFRGTFGSYAAGDTLRIALEAGVVKYYRNANLLYASAQAPTLPLRVDTSLCSTGAAVQAAVLSGTLVDIAAPATEPVAWTNMVGVSATASALTKTAATAWGNAGAASTRGLNGNGYLEFTLPAAPGYVMFGLSNGDSDQGYADIDFAFYTYPGNGQLMVYEKGVFRGQLGAYAAGDKLRVSLDSGVVKYWFKGTLVYTSAQVPTLPLRADTSFYSTGASLDAVLSGILVDIAAPATESVVWANLVGVSATASTLTKTAATAWGNAGAASTRGVNGNGYAEFTVPASPGYAMFGLSNGDSDQGYADIDFAFYTYPGTGQLMIYENGVYRGQFGAYAAGDKLRVSVASGVVTYLFKGTVVYTSAQAPTLPLRVDTSLYSAGAVIQGATLSGNLAP